FEYLLSRSAFWTSFTFARDVSYVRPPHRWRKTEVGSRCTIGRTYPSINWQVDGSRVWSWELDPKRFPRFHATPFSRGLRAWRNGYYDNWSRLDPGRIAQLERVLALARTRGWHVVGFAPPEPASILKVLEHDPRLAPQWDAFVRLMPRLFARYGDEWIGLGVHCPASQFPDEFHTDATCSRRLRLRLDEAARSLH